jgi:hypothetical protein
MTNSTTPSKSAINPLAFLPFGIYMAVSITQKFVMPLIFMSNFQYIGGFVGLLKAWVIPGVLLLAAAVLISKKIISIALAVAAIVWQLFVVIGAQYLIEFLSPSSKLGYGWYSSVDYFAYLICFFVAPMLAIVLALSRTDTDVTSG